MTEQRKIIHIDMDAFYAAVEQRDEPGLRPAAVLADVGRGDYILCQITSNRYADADAVELRDEHFSRGSLRRLSYARPGKLFTANDALIVREAGELKVEVRRAVVEAIEKLLRKDLP